MITSTHIPHLGLKIVLASHAFNKGTDIKVYDNGGQEIMTSIIATDIADKLAIVFDIANAKSGYAPDERARTFGQPLTPEGMAAAIERMSHGDAADALHASGIEATLRARILSLERDIRSIQASASANGAELIRLRSERNSFNVRDRATCERIQKAEARIRKLEAESVPALIGQRNAWRDIAARLHDILKNKDPS